jgi:uncharacterized protein (TIGR00375 family)
MNFIADFHIHSQFSRATSKELIPENLDQWAGIKGITVVGTGDFTHPGWLKELKEKLEPAEQGLLRLKDQYRSGLIRRYPEGPVKEARFLLTAEISSIYKKGDKVRKIHNVVFAPDFTTVEKIQHKLSRIGNITSDGRPILGLDAKELLDLILSSSEEAFFVPAHIWTPWFSVLGSKSGFDSIEECFEDLTGHIYALETGLSSDPPMNWLCSFLDRFTLISNSDAHSPEKLGREANLFNTNLSYDAIIDALKSKDSGSFQGTIEFFPEEGKYHFDGHRKCGICWEPAETRKHCGTCPECGKKVTVGVMNRVSQLADRNTPAKEKTFIPCHSLIPLKEILSEILGTGPQSKKVSQAYDTLIREAGSEFNILLHLPPEEINNTGMGLLTEAVKRMRKGEVYIKGGYDGEYGTVKVFREHEKKLLGPQESLFKDFIKEKGSGTAAKKRSTGREVKNSQLNPPSSGKPASEPPKAAGPYLLNAEQQKAVEHTQGPSLVIAGPGTGKTGVLVHKILNLILRHAIAPEHILAITFTNKAAGEMKGRLCGMSENNVVPTGLQVYTFHALGLSVITENLEHTGRKDGFIIIDEDDRERMLVEKTGCKRKEAKKTSRAITAVKLSLRSADSIEEPKFAGIFNTYEKVLRKDNLFDLDDLIYQTVLLLEREHGVLNHYRDRYRWIIIDEYQDINLSQYRMIKMLAPGKDANLCAIGDPDQAIYGFRGADVRFIEKFRDDYPGAAVFKLKKSYRCSDSILRASGKVIPKPDREHAWLEGIGKGVKIKITENRSDKSEAEYVARIIEKLVGGVSFFSIDSEIIEGGRDATVNSLSDIAILCRIRAQMGAIAKALRDHMIPCQMIGNASFFEQEPVKSIMLLVALSLHPDNEFLKGKVREQKSFLQADLSHIHDFAQKPSTGDMILSIVEEYFKNEISAYEMDIKHLIGLAEDFGNDAAGFLRHSALWSEADAGQSGVERVSLMTLHAAKGLEFKCVFIIGCEEGLIPYSLFQGRKTDPDEERRLLYVGMTRAKELLYLCHAAGRTLNGRKYNLARSPFLNNIEKELIETSRSEYKRKEKPEERQLSMF